MGLACALLVAGANNATGVDGPLAGQSVATLESAGAFVGSVVATTPAAWTPQVRDGSVWAITQTGSTMVVGGDFATVRTPQGGSRELKRSNVFAFDATTGKIADFAPKVDGRVNAVTPGKTPGTVYVAGSFTELDGRTGRVFLLDATTGRVLDGFTPAAISGPVNDLALVGDRLYIGGTFTHVGGWPHAGIAALKADSGARDPFVNIQLQGHHNWAPGSGTAQGATGAVAFDINPDGTSMVVVGNFKTVDDRDLDQVFVADLTGSAARIADWQTDRFDPTCSGAFDSYMRDVKWSPDGKHFSIVTTGAGYAGTLCDTLSTWSGAQRGSDLEPLWVEETGGDSLYSLAHTDSAVYYGGHQRWGNNPNARDFAYFGAVPRPGLSAADPNGLVPIDWNPGRNPRGFGVTAMFANSAGVWLGSDTEWFGDFEIFRPRLAFFPASGGRPLARGAYPYLPAYVHLIDKSGVRRFPTDGTSLGAAESFDSGDLVGDRVRGAFVVDDNLFYGASDGYLYRRKYDGLRLGPAQRIDPYNDPKWSDALTGWQDQVYRGRTPQLYSQFDRQVAGLEVRDNVMYFTRPRSDTLFRTGFSSDSGTIEPFFPATSGGTAVPGKLSNPGDFVFFGDTIVYVDTSNGVLRQAPLTSAGVGASTVLDATRDYRGRGLFIAKGPNRMPTADFTTTCSDLTCTLDASGSTDSDGQIVAYDWDFGDGTVYSGQTTTHTFTGGGEFVVGLTVTDDRGATARKTVAVSVSPPPPPVSATPTPSPSRRAGSGSGAGDPRDPDPVKQPSDPRARPAAVTGITVTKRSRRQVTVRYRPVPGADFYRFRVKRPAAKKWRSAGSTSTTTHTVRNLKPRRAYQIRIVAKKGDYVSRAVTIRVRTR